MATASKTLPVTDEPQTEVVIERREIIATLKIDPIGPGPSLFREAYSTMGEYLAENAGGTNPITVGFHFGGAEWSAAYTPDQELIEAAKKRQEAYDNDPYR